MDNMEHLDKTFLKMCILHTNNEIWTKNFEPQDVWIDYDIYAAYKSHYTLMHMGLGQPPFGLPPIGLGLPPIGLSPFGLPPIGLPPIGLPPFGLPPIGLRGHLDWVGSQQSLSSQFKHWLAATINCLMTRELG